jgi:hypothetical protein
MELGAQLDELGGELVGFAAGGAVADGDQRDLVLLAQPGQRVQAAVPVAAGLVGVDHAGVDELAGLVHHGHLDAGAQARVEAQGGAGAGGGGQQQVFEVAPEDADGFFLGLLAQLAEELEFEVQRDLDAPGPAHGLAQPGVGRAALVLDAEVAGDAPLAGVGAGRAAVGGVGVEPSCRRRKPSLRPRNSASARWDGTVSMASRKSNQSRNLAAAGSVSLSAITVEATTPWSLRYSRSLPMSSASSAKRSIRIWRAPSSTALVSAKPASALR